MIWHNRKQLVTDHIITSRMSPVSPVSEADFDFESTADLHFWTLSRREAESRVLGCNDIGLNGLIGGLRRYTGSHEPLVKVPFSTV